MSFWERGHFNAAGHLSDGPSIAFSFKNPISDSSKWLTGKELADVYIGFINNYDIVSIEDPFDQVRQGNDYFGIAY